MSKYNDLWEYVQKNGNLSMKLSFDEIHDIIGMDIDHSFLNYKNELTQYGYQVGKISLKEKTVVFNKIVWCHILELWIIYIRVRDINIKIY